MPADDKNRSSAPRNAGRRQKPIVRATKCRQTTKTDRPRHESQVWS
jgi:hypothetical protein